MIGSRITHSSVAQNALANMQAAYARSARVSDQLTSGKKLQVPSDDPSGAVATMKLRSDLRAQEQYARNGQDGLGWLSVADSALQSASSELRSAYEAVLQASNQGIMNEDSRLALAQKVRAVRDEMVSIANRTYLDRPVFGGTTLGTTAFEATPDATGQYVFLGDTGAVNRRLDDSTTVRVDTPAADAFVGADGKSVFQMLTEVADHIESSPELLSVDIGRIQAAAKQITSTLADVGVRYNRVESLRLTAQDAQITLQAGISDIEDVDIPKAMIEMRMADMAYQASLAATAKVIQPTLLDFLR